MDRFAPKKPKWENVLNVWRPGERTSAEVIILSGEVTAVYCHWFGRSLLCPGEDCAACIQGQLPRWVGLLAIGQPTGERQIIELGAKTSAQLDRLQGERSLNSLAGIVIEIKKNLKHDPITIKNERTEPIKVTPVSEHLVLESYFVHLGLRGQLETETWDKGYVGSIKTMARHKIAFELARAEARQLW